MPRVHCGSYVVTWFLLVYQIHIDMWHLSLSAVVCGGEFRGCWGIIWPTFTGPEPDFYLWLHNGVAEEKGLERLHISWNLTQPYRTCPGPYGNHGNVQCHDKLDILCVHNGHLYSLGLLHFLCSWYIFCMPFWVHRTTGCMGVQLLPSCHWDEELRGRHGTLSATWGRSGQSGNYWRIRYRPILGTTYVHTEWPYLFCSNFVTVTSCVSF